MSEKPAKPSKEDNYKELIRTIRLYLKSRVSGMGISKVLELKQFGWVVHYLPAYEVLWDIMNGFEDDLGELDVDFKCLASDSNVVLSVLDTKEEERSPSKKGPIIFGLGDLHGESKDSDDNLQNSIHRYFIRRLPVWGLALVNNAKINELVAEKKDKLLGDFWKVFEGKLSLLDANDMKSLRLSIYPEGTTVRRLLVDYLDEKNGDKVDARSIIGSVGFENEYDPLFQRNVDVAMTIHPWKAINWKSNVFSPRDIQVVYTHLGKPEKFTSFFMPKVLKHYENRVLTDFLELFFAAVCYQIDCFYSSDRKAKKAIVHYCSLQKDFSKTEEKISDCTKGIYNPKLNTEKGTTIPCECFKPYLEQQVGTIKRAPECVENFIGEKILNDSRIYHYDFNLELVEVNAKFIKSVYEYESFQKVGNGRELKESRPFSVDYFSEDELDRLNDPIATLTFYFSDETKLSKHQKANDDDWQGPLNWEESRDELDIFMNNLAGVGGFETLREHLKVTQFGKMTYNEIFNFRQRLKWGNSENWAKGKTANLFRFAEEDGNKGRIFFFPFLMEEVLGQFEELDTHDGVHLGCLVNEDSHDSYSFVGVSYENNTRVTHENILKQVRADPRAQALLEVSLVKKQNDKNELIPLLTKHGKAWRLEGQPETLKDGSIVESKILMDGTIDNNVRLKFSKTNHNCLLVFRFYIKSNMKMEEK